MRCYGQVKGRKYYAQQETVEQSENYRLCKSCNNLRPIREFKGDCRVYKSCKKCRDKARAYLERNHGR